MFNTNLEKIVTSGRFLSYLMTNLRSDDQKNKFGVREFDYPILHYIPEHFRNPSQLPNENLSRSKVEIQQNSERKSLFSYLISRILNRI